jgi:hypothetical protein
MRGSVAEVGSSLHEEIKLAELATATARPLSFQSSLSTKVTRTVICDAHVKELTGPNY